MPVLVLVLVVAAAAAAIVYVPRLQAASAKNDAVSDCAALQAQLAGMGQGADPATRAGVQAQLDACVQRAIALGIPIDAAGVTLAECDSAYAQIEAETTHYASTSNSDIIKRNSTRGTILRLGEDLAAHYMTAIAQATTAGALNLIRLSILRTLEGSISRELRFLAGSAGYDVLGANEPGNEQRAADELARVYVPNLRAYDACVARLFVIGGASGADLSDPQSSYGRRHAAAVLVRRFATREDQLDAEWAAYCSVDSGDVAQREAKRAHMLTLGAQVVETLRDAVSRAYAPEDWIGLKAPIMRAIAGASNRYTAFVNHAPGAAKGTFSAEPDDASKAAAEKATTLDALAPLKDEVFSAAGNVVDFAKIGPVVRGSRFGFGFSGVKVGS